ncbi:MAG: Hpt domain-containing protein [Flavobacteriales bacterium]|nr:Hpt domain-containing protein [Flavobacteriales bacterium]
MKKPNYFNIESLKKITNAGNQSLIEYLTIYIEQTPNDIKKLQQFYQDGDSKNLAMLAHNLKSRSRYMGIHDLGQLAEKMEKFDFTTQNKAILNQIINQFIEIYTYVEADLKIEKENLSKL